MNRLAVSRLEAFFVAACNLECSHSLRVSFSARITFGEGRSTRFIQDSLEFAAAQHAGTLPSLGTKPKVLYMQLDKFKQ
eukprot:389955-Pelagomonas_calceolata.AAC.1